MFCVKCNKEVAVIISEDIEASQIITRCVECHAVLNYRHE
jgi:hypothetical protein